MRDTFIQTLQQLASQNSNLMLLTGDLGFKVLDGFQEKYPRQFLNVGVAEQNMLGIATGLALEGKQVFVYSITNFPTLRCLEQIRNDACYHDANVKIVSVGAGFTYGALGISHHCTEDIAILRSLPNLQILSPCDRWETQQITQHLANQPGTFYLRLDKSLATTRPDTQQNFELGKMRLLREGKQVTIFATGGIVQEALTAADQLSSEKIECRVYSVHTLKPIDRETIEKAVKETDYVVTLEEHTVAGGLGSIIAETCLEQGWIPKKFLRIGLQDQFSSVVGSQSYLRKIYQMDSASIVQKIKGLF